MKAASLTGSEPAGAQVAAQAGRLIKKTVLELGGSDPFIVMPTADLDRAVKTAVEARVINNGQSCIAAKRFIIDAASRPHSRRRFVRQHGGAEGRRSAGRVDAAWPAGNTDPSSKIWTGRCRNPIAMGARLLTGGKRIEGKGNYYAPTVLTDVPAGSPAQCEELFGPVAVLFQAKGIDDAIRIANDTEFGLGASAWTEDAAEQQKLIDELESGQVFVNGMVASDARLPFGGVKTSGYGRELGTYGIREFENIKTVRVL